jgi:hypothetical protein
MSEQDDPIERRATMLPLMLGAMLAFLFAVFLVLITGGFFLYVVAAGGAILLLGTLHWVVWGKLLTEQTAGEREEMDLLERARGEDGLPKGTYRR